MTSRQAHSGTVAVGRGRRGQSTVEYMMVVSVLVIAVVSVGYGLRTIMKSGFDAMLDDTETVLGAPSNSGSNNKR